MKILLFVLLLIPNTGFCAFTPDPVYGPIINNQTSHLYTAECTTDAAGQCEIVVTIPGSSNAFSASYFNGYSAPVNTLGRYMQSGECQFQDGELGDRVTALQLEDRAGHIPEGSRAAFPSYPVISRFFDSAMSASNQGWVLWPNRPTSISALGYPKFVPTPLSIVAKFQKKTAAAGKAVYCNYNLSKHEMVK